MGHHRWTLLFAVLSVLFFTMPTPAQQPSAALRRFDFLDDHDRRRLADIQVQIVERDGLRSLELIVSAVGPLVDPIGGFAGVRGANRHTAEQLDNILAGRFAFLVRTQHADGTAPWFGKWREGRRGRLPERRIGADGRIDFLAMTPREYPIDLIVETGGVKDGRQSTELWFNHATRLRITYTVNGDKARIVDFASLGNTPFLADGNELVQPDGKAARQPEPFKLPIPEADWNAKDIEGKWVYFEKTVADDNKRAQAFVAWIAERKEYDLLELIALHHPFYEGGIAAGRALALADAPQWLRVVAWLRLAEGSHGEAETTKLLNKVDPAKAVAWLDRHVDEAILSKGEQPSRGTRGNANPLLGDYLTLKLKKIKPGEIGNALPPLDPAVVFRHLDAPTDLADFGDRAKAEPGKVYVHQVLRALQGFLLTGKSWEPWIGKVRQLTRHPDVRVRQKALLAFTHFADSLPGNDDAVHEFRRTMEDPKEPPVIREAALMAFSYLSHPQVYVRLHEIAMDVKHPAWRGAVSRLRDLGDEFTVKTLFRIDADALPIKDGAFLRDQRAELSKTIEDPGYRRNSSANGIRRNLEQVAWADHTKSPIAAAYSTWTKNYYVSNRDKDLDYRLSEVHNSYAPNFSIGNPPDMSRRVRALVHEILTTAGPRP